MPQLVNFGRPEATFRQVEEKAETDPEIKLIKLDFDQAYEEPSDFVDIVSAR